MDKVSPNNRGPYLNVGMWIIIVPTVMMVAAKVYTKWYTTNKIMADDVLIGIALLTAVAQSVAITEEVKFGVGRRQDALSNSDFDNLLKAQYISNIFYVMSIYASKLSTAYFYTGFCKSNTATKIMRWTIWSMVIWVLTSVVTLLAQCHLPRPWDSFGTTCIDLKAFWIVSLVVDIVTQTAITFLPIYLLSDLHMSNKSSKWLVMGLFIPNLILIPFAILRLVLLFHAIDSSDYAWESFNFGFLTSFQPFVAIMVTSIPFIKPVLDSLVLQAPLIAVEQPQSVIPKNYKATSWAQFIQDSYASRSQRLGRSSKSRKGSSGHWPYTQRQEEDSVDLGHELNNGDYTARVERGKSSDREGEGDSVGSADKMVIRQTKVTTVESK